MSNILIDTNILIYALDANSRFFMQSTELLNNEKVTLYTTTKNISEYFAVCTKLKLESENIFGFYHDIKANIRILKPTENSLIIFEKLMQKYKPTGNRVYDIEIVSVMLDNKIKKIATVNTSDFKDIEEIEVVDLP